jgi:hypothetical protein
MSTVSPTKRRWFQWSLRTWFVAVTAAAIVAYLEVYGSHIDTSEEKRDRKDLVELVSESDAVVMPDASEGWTKSIVVADVQELQTTHAAFVASNLIIIPNDRKLMGFGHIAFTKDGMKIAGVGYFQDSIISYKSTYFRLRSDPFRQRIYRSPESLGLPDSPSSAELVGLMFLRASGGACAAGLAGLFAYLCFRFFLGRGHRPTHC